MNSVIIVAGGSGKRMATATPKQFLLLDGKPILMHTIENFYNFDPSMQIIVVLPEAHHSTWMELCQKYDFTIHHSITTGGSERFYSVKNGMKLIPPDVDIVAVHDGVRPLTSVDTLSRCFNAAKVSGAAIPVIPLVDSIRRISSDSSVSENRAMFRAVQTPQCFSSKLLFNAYEADFSPAFTDDASVVEAFFNKTIDKSENHKISLVDGNIENIKITNPSDFVLAEFFIKDKK